jgi:hypothetical protein
MGRSAHCALRLLNAPFRRYTAPLGVETCNFLSTVATWLREAPQKGVENTQRKVVRATYRHSSSPGG